MAPRDQIVQEALTWRGTPSFPSTAIAFDYCFCKGYQMTIRDQIVEEALSWNNTKWHHRACVKGVGVDCVRLLEAVAKHCGLLVADWQVPEYSSEWHLHNNEETLLMVLAELGCRPIPLAARQPGDLLTLQYGRVSSHAAILTSCSPDYIIHARGNPGCVVHQGLSGDQLKRVRSVWSFPGVEGAP